MDYLSYVSPELMILIPVIYAIGLNLKHAEKMDDKYIPALLTVIAVFLTLLYMIATQGFSAMGIFTGIIQGVLIAAAAVYTNQLIKQAKE